MNSSNNNETKVPKIQVGGKIHVSDNRTGLAHARRMMKKYPDTGFGVTKISKNWFVVRYE